MKKSNTNLILIFSIILLVLVTSFFVYFLNIIKNKNNHTSAVVIALEKKIADKENINTLKEKMDELLNTNNELGGYIVETSKAYVFVEYLESLGTDNNVELVVDSVEVPKNEKNKILVSLNIIAGFSDTMKVIAILENSPYNITMVSSSINKEIILPDNTQKLPTPNPTQFSWQTNLKFNVLSL